MIPIPSKEKQFSQPNTSDLFGNIWYTKNLDFDEPGYVKLASRSVSILNEEDASYLEMVTAFGRSSGINFFAVSFDSPVDITLADNSVVVAQDTGSGAPSFGAVSHGKWFQNRWHATSQTDMYYKTTIGGAWTDALTGTPLTTSVTHPIEVFRNRNTICVGNGNVVKQYDTSYANSIDLTIPTDYEVKFLAYCNNKMGVATKLADTVAGQNQEAYFFVWNGSSTTAEGGGYPVGSDRICGLVAYKQTWVILTRTGEVLKFNGGGFNKLENCDLAFYFKGLTWGDFLGEDTYGDVMTVEGDLIYFNLDNLYAKYGVKSEMYLENAPGGILCYDPKVGLYHRYSPSNSKASFVTVTSGNVNTTTDIMTSTSGTLPATGNPIKYTYLKSSQIGGLTTGVVYYIIKHTSTTFSLATSYANAINGVKIDLTSTGNANNYFLALNVVDYGASRMARTGGVALLGAQSQVYDHLIYSADLYDTNSTTAYANICLTVSGFENRGYLVTAKIPSNEIEDNITKIFTKYKPLGSIDKIIVKYKNADVIGIPVTTPQYALSCSWSDSNTLTTTADLSEVYTYLQTSGNECELEVIAGAGAGQMAQISSITFNAGTYTVNLAEDFVGATSGNVCDILINNWKLLGTMDSTDTKGWEELSIAKASKWVLLKIELRGVDTTLEEEKIINQTELKAI